MDDTQTTTVPPQIQTSASGNVSQKEEHTLVQFPKAPAQPVPQPSPAAPSQDEEAFVLPSWSDTTEKIAQPAQVVPDEQSVSGLGKHKEVEPMPSLSGNLSEVLQPTETNVNIEPAVEEAGVKEVNHLPQLSQDDIQAGLHPAKEAVPVGASYVPVSKPVKAPMTEDEAKLITKKPLAFQDSSSSMVWLAYLWTRYYSLHEKEKEEKNK